MILENGTDQPWHFGVYQKHPSSPRLTSVAWQVRGIPPQAGSVLSSAQSNLDTGLYMVSALQILMKMNYTGKQFAPAYLGNVYKVVSLDSIPSIDTKPIAIGSSDQIVLKNHTGPYANTLTMGFTVSNNIIAVEDSIGGEQETIYRVHPTYYVACYRNIVLGQFVDEGVHGHWPSGG